jgi:hypothetical protein
MEKILLKYLAKSIQYEALEIKYVVIKNNEMNLIKSQIINPVINGLYLIEELSFNKKIKLIIYCFKKQNKIIYAFNISSVNNFNIKKTIFIEHLDNRYKITNKNILGICKFTIFDLKLKINILEFYNLHFLWGLRHYEEVGEIPLSVFVDTYYNKLIDYSKYENI